MQHSFADKVRFNVLPSNATSVAASSWISVVEKFTVAPGSAAVVPFAVAVPSNATPGDHAAGIAASVLSKGGQDSVQALGSGRREAQRGRGNV